VTISVRLVVRNFAYGNPASLGEPLGLWQGQALVTGDATLGRVDVDFVPQNPADTPTLLDQRRQYVYFVDGISGVTDPAADPGTVEATISTHFARANAALAGFQSVVARDMISTGRVFAPTGDLMPPGGNRIPIFWDSQELAGSLNQIVTVVFSANILNLTYTVGAYGRYYDRQVLSNRSFGRLVSPPPVAPFD